MGTGLDPNVGLPHDLDVLGRNPRDNFGRLGLDLPEYGRPIFGAIIEPGREIDSPTVDLHYRVVADILFGSCRSAPHQKQGQPKAHDCRKPLCVPKRGEKSVSAVVVAHSGGDRARSDQGEFEH